MSTKSLDPKLADFPVTSVEKLRYADTDLQGHITNTVFAVCCQNARMELLCDPQRVPIPPVRHCQAGAGIPGRDALAWHGRDRHPRGTGGAILANPRTGLVRQRALRSGS
jgi:hypothetical protein